MILLLHMYERIMYWYKYLKYSRILFTNLKYCISKSINVYIIRTAQQYVYNSLKLLSLDYGNCSQQCGLFAFKMFLPNQLFFFNLMRLKNVNQ